MTTKSLIKSATSEPVNIMAGTTMQAIVFGQLPARWIEAEFNTTRECDDGIWRRFENIKIPGGVIFYGWLRIDLHKMKEG